MCIGHVCFSLGHWHPLCCRLLRLESATPFLPCFPFFSLPSLLCFLPFPLPFAKTRAPKCARRAGALPRFPAGASFLGARRGLSARALSKAPFQDPARAFGFVPCYDEHPGPRKSHSFLSFVELGGCFSHPATKDFAPTMGPRIAFL